MAQRKSGYERNDDEAYFTPGWVTKLALKSLEPHSFDAVYDGASGAGHILQAVEEFWCDIPTIGTDLNAWRPQVCSAEIWLMSFLAVSQIPTDWGERVLLMFNPPFGHQGRLAEQFIEHACTLIKGTQHEAMFLLAHNFDAAKGRTQIFTDCQQYSGKLIVLPRIQWANIEPDPEHDSSSDHAWYHWKGEPAPGLPVTRWLGNHEVDRSFDVWDGLKQAQ